MRVKTKIKINQTDINIFFTRNLKIKITQIKRKNQKNKDQTGKKNNKP